jgi:hypothetical protein
MIDWCLMPTLAIFQLYRGVKKFGCDLSSTKNLFRFMFNFKPQREDSEKA